MWSPDQRSAAGATARGLYEEHLLTRARAGEAPLLVLHRDHVAAGQLEEQVSSGSLSLTAKGLSVSLLISLQCSQH
jgi:hypothetical protein